MSAVATYSYTQSVTYVADNILKSIKDIIRLSGLDPTHFTDGWATHMCAIKAWLESRHLERVILEVYDPLTDALLFRWDIDVVYSWTGAGDGSFWTDTEQLRWAIKKAGVAPSQAKYGLLLNTKPGRPDVAGWGPASARSSEGLVRQSLGSTIEHYGLGGSTAYWRRR